jgi:hypothetical protein
MSRISRVLEYLSSDFDGMAVGHFGGTRLLTSLLARTLAPPINEKIVPTFLFLLEQNPY